MDPISAFSLAGTVLQFLDSGSRFVLLAKRLYDGNLEEAPLSYAALQTAAVDLEEILPQLDNSTDGSNDGQVRQLAHECGKTARKLLVTLGKLKLEDAPRKRDAIKTAFRSICKEKEINSRRNQIQELRTQISFHLSCHCGKKAWSEIRHVETDLGSFREHVAKSVKQQDEIASQLGVTKQHVSEPRHGLATDIMSFISSKAGLNKDSGLYISIRSLLIQSVYEIGHDKPTCINLSAKNQELAQSQFLKRLSYDGMIDRESRIKEAHEVTLRWVLRPSSEQVDDNLAGKWSNLREWLESDQQLFWITGKAGSGKSTITKYLCAPVRLAGSEPKKREYNAGLEVRRCHPYQKKWAGTSHLIIASFYFWNSGTKLQMNEEGLLRILLYQIIAQRPDIIPNIAPHDWEVLCLFGDVPLL